MVVFGEQIDDAVADACLELALAPEGSTTQTDLAAILQGCGVTHNLEAACRIFAREKRRGTLVWVERERVWRKA